MRCSIRHHRHTVLLDRQYWSASPLPSLPTPSQSQEVFFFLQKLRSILLHVTFSSFICLQVLNRQFDTVLQNFSQTYSCSPCVLCFRSFWERPFLLASPHCRRCVPCDPSVVMAPNELPSSEVHRALANSTAHLCVHHAVPVQRHTACVWIVS